MQRFAAVFSTLAVLMTAAHVSGQQAPNFSGQWTLVAPADAPAGGAPDGRRGGGGGGGGGARGGRGGGRGAFGALTGLGMGGTITQDAATLTITRTTQAGEIKTVYRLDGSESRNSITMGGGNGVESVSKARWEGSKLVITSTTNVQGNPVESTMTLSLDGQNLVIESTGAGRGGGATVTTTTRYTKSN
jgi:hypothetical protein